MAIESGLYTTAAAAPAASSYLGPLTSSMGPMIGSLIGQNTYTNPADAANKYLSQIQSTVSPYYQPYIDAGLSSLPQLMNMYSKLMSNPADIIKQLGGTYQASPGYQYNVQQATNAANQAAASGGMQGTPQEQQQLSSVISGLASQDYNNYMNQVLGVGKYGIGGMQGINQMGYNASNSLANQLSQMLMAQATASYAGAANQNQQSGGLISGTLDAIGL